MEFIDNLLPQLTTCVQTVECNVDKSDVFYNTVQPV